MYRSTDRYDTKPPTTTVTRLPFSFDANELEPWNVELWRLKNFCENFTNQIIFSLFKVPIKHIQEKAKEKEIWLQRKMNIFLSQLLFNCNIEKKNKDFLCQICLLSIDLFWLTSCTFDFFYLRVTSRSWTYRSETLEKLSKHQKLWWKRCAG